MTRKRNFVAYLVGALMLVAVPATAQDKADDSAQEKPAANKKADAKKKEAKPKPKAEAQRQEKPKKKAARAASSSSSASEDLKVVESKAAGGVTDRDPVDEASSFDAGDQVTIWAAIRNTTSPEDIKMVWFANGTEVTSVDIEVGKSWRWRTWSKSKVWAGDWKVEIQDSSGSVLDTVEFSVKEA